MAEFGAAAELELRVTSSEIRSVRREVEEGLDDIEIGVSASTSGGGRGQQPRDPQTGQFVSSMGPEQFERTSLSLDEDRNAILEDVVDELEDMRGGTFVGGGGGGGGAGIGGGGGGGGFNLLELFGTGTAGTAVGRGSLSLASLVPSAGTALAAGSVLAGGGIGLAGAQGLENVGALDALRGAGQGLNQLVGGQNAEMGIEALSAANPAFGALAIGGGAIQGFTDPNQTAIEGAQQTAEVVLPDETFSEIESAFPEPEDLQLEPPEPGDLPTLPVPNQSDIPDISISGEAKTLFDQLFNGGGNQPTAPTDTRSQTERRRGRVNDPNAPSPRVPSGQRTPNNVSVTVQNTNPIVDDTGLEDMVENVIRDVISTTGPIGFGGI